MITDTKPNKNKHFCHSISSFYLKNSQHSLKQNIHLYKAKTGNVNKGLKLILIHICSIISKLYVNYIFVNEDIDITYTSISIQI